MELSLMKWLAFAFVVLLASVVALTLAFLRF
jgi:hypothetical protein